MSNNNPVIPRVDALLRARDATYLDASRNGHTGGRLRVRKPLRLPPDLWDRIGGLAIQLQQAFPERYITTTSTIEFLLNEGLSLVVSSPYEQAAPIPDDI
jgi:hypothetical protein